MARVLSIIFIFAGIYSIQAWSQESDQEMERLRVENENLKRQLEMDKLRQENEQLKKAIEFKDLKQENENLKKQTGVIETQAAEKPATKILPDFSDDNSEIVMDHHFMVEKGKFLLSAGLGKSTSETSQEYRSQAVARTKESEYDAGLDIKYGIVKGTQIEATVVHALSDEAQIQYGVASTKNGTTTTYKSDGIYDPVFTLKHRLLTQEFTSLYCDLQLGYSPKMAPAKNASTTTRGTMGRGGQAFLASAEVTKKTHALTTFLNSEYIYRTNEHRKDMSDGSRESREWTSQALIGAGIQKILTPSASFQIEAQYFWNSNAHVSGNSGEYWLGKSSGTKISLEILGYSQSKNMEIGVSQSFTSTNEHDVVYPGNTINIAEDTDSETALTFSIYF